MPYYVLISIRPKPEWIYCELTAVPQYSLLEDPGKYMYQKVLNRFGYKLDRLLCLSTIADATTFKSHHPTTPWPDLCSWPGPFLIRRIPLNKNLYISRL